MSTEVKNVRVHEFGKPQIETWQLENHPLADDEIIVKVNQVPVNPSDYYRIRGEFRDYNAQTPFTPGLEGLGRIIKIGKNIDKKIEGKNAIFITFKGTYSTHIIVKRNEVYVLDDKVNLDIAGQNFAINPFTAIALIKEVKDSKTPAIILTAASSNVGKWLIVLAKKQKINTIAITRSYDHDIDLKSIGADVVLNSKAENFDQLLGEAIEKLKPTVLLDALAGLFPVNILKKMPPKSTLWSYGVLEAPQLENIGIFSLTHGRGVKGFLVFTDYTDVEKIETLEKELSNALLDEHAVKEKLTATSFEKIEETLQQWPERKNKFVINF